MRELLDYTRVMARRFLERYETFVRINENNNNKKKRNKKTLMEEQNHQVHPMNFPLLFQDTVHMSPVPIV